MGWDNEDIEVVKDALRRIAFALELRYLDPENHHECEACGCSIVLDKDDKCPACGTVS